MSLDLARPIDTILTELGDRVTAAETAPRLSANATSYLSSISGGALIASLSQPYGVGTTYQVVGVAPSQLALSNGQIVAGTGMTGNANRKVMIRAISADGTRQIAETLSFSEVYAAPAPAPTPTPSPTPTPTPSPTPAPTPTPTVALSGAVSHSEGNSGTTAYLYTVTRSSIGSGAIDVPYTFSPGTTSADDWVGGAYPAAGTCTIASGALTGTYSFFVAGDTTAETDETFSTAITAPAGYALGSPSNATGTILNDDAGSGGGGETLPVGPQPISAAMLVDNGNGTFTVTPPVWPTGVVVSGQSKGRNSAPVAGLAGNGFSVTGDDALSFVDYQETGTKAGFAPVVARSNGFALQPAASVAGNFVSIHASTQSAAHVPIFDEYPSLSTYSAGETTKITDIDGLRFESASQTTHLAIDVLGLDFDQSWQEAYGTESAIFDKDPATGDFSMILFESGNYFRCMRYTVANGQLNRVGEAYAFAASPSDYANAKDYGSALCRRRHRRSGFNHYIEIAAAGASVADIYGPFSQAQFGGFAKTSIIGLGSGGYSVFDHWVPTASVSALTVLGFQVLGDGTLQYSGVSASVVPSFEQQLFTRNGALYQDWTPLTTVSQANGAWVANTADKPGHDPAITGKSLRTLIRRADNHAVVFPSLQAIPNFAPLRPFKAGINLNGFGVFTTEQGSQNFAGGNTYQRFDGGGASVNGSDKSYDMTAGPGYPALVNAAGDMIHAGAILQFSHPPTSPCTYDFEWDGAPSAVLNFQPSSGDLQITAQTRTGPTSYRVTQIFTPGSHANYCGAALQSITAGEAVGNVRIYKVGADRSLFWTPEYTARQAVWRGPARFMDIRFINANIKTLTTATRAQTGKYQYGNGYSGALEGVPREFMIAWCNAQNVDCWLNVPLYAGEDSYYVDLLNSFYDGSNTDNGIALNVGLHVILEPGNEVGWNYGFPIYRDLRVNYSARTGEAVLGDGNGGVDQGFKEYAYRWNYIMALVEQSRFWTQGQQSRVIRTLGTISDSPNEYNSLRSYMGQSGTDRIDAVCIAPYYRVYYSNNPTTDFDQLEILYKAEIDRRYQQELQPVFDAVVTRDGRRLIFYEGGMDLDSSGLPQQYWDTFKQSIQYYRIQKYMFSAQKARFGDLYCHYTDCGQAWGLELYDGDPAPQGRQALLDAQAGVY